MEPGYEARNSLNLVYIGVGGRANVLATFTAGLGCSGVHVQKELAEGACPPLGIVT